MPLPRFRLRSLMLAVVASACILGGLIQFRPPHEPGDFQLGILLVGGGAAVLGAVLTSMAVGEG
jgi:uncharacterized membrane protein YccC